MRHGRNKGQQTFRRVYFSTRLVSSVMSFTVQKKIILQVRGPLRITFKKKIFFQSEIHKLVCTIYQLVYYQPEDQGKTQVNYTINGPLSSHRECHKKVECKTVRKEWNINLTRATYFIRADKTVRRRTLFATGHVVCIFQWDSQTLSQRIYWSFWKPLNPKGVSDS